MFMLKRSIATALRARDFMQTDLLTVTPETPLIDIQRMFVEEEIHGAPVVDEDGKVRGVVSTLDLVRALREEHDAEDVTPDVAADVMTPELVTVTSETPIAEVAQAMRGQHIHRVLVVDAGELVGVITSFDLLRAFIPVQEASARPGSR
jgi:CBS domain-containing protein